MELYDKILTDIKGLEDYEAHDLIIDILDHHSEKSADGIITDSLCIDTVGCTIDRISKGLKYEILDYILESIKEDLKKEYIAAAKKDDGFYNVKAHSIEKDFNIINDIQGMLY